MVSWPKHQGILQLQESCSLQLTLAHMPIVYAGSPESPLLGHAQHHPLHNGPRGTFHNRRRGSVWGCGNGGGEGITHHLGRGAERRVNPLLARIMEEEFCHMIFSRTIRREEHPR